MQQVVLYFYNKTTSTVEENPLKNSNTSPVLQSNNLSPEKEASQELPSTGETEFITFYLLGSLLITVGLGLGLILYKKIKRTYSIKNY